MKRKLSLSLALAMLILLALTSCSGAGETSATKSTTPSPEGDTASTPVTTEQALTPDLPEANYGGRDFTFLVREYDPNGYWGSREIFAEGENGEPINDAVYARNRKIEAQLGVSIKEVRTNDVAGMTRKVWKAGDDIYDCVMPSGTDGANMATQGMLLSFNRLPYVDLTKPWWDKKVNDSVTVGGDQFFAVGELNIMDNDSTWVVMFNKTVAKNAAVEDMYALVKGGQWTIDRMHQICRDVSRDLNGDGKMDDNDLAGLLSDTGVIAAAYYNTGEHMCLKDGEDMPYIVIGGERGVLAIEKIYGMFGDKASAVLADNLKHITNPWTDGLNIMFKNDRGLFYAIGLTVMHKMRDMDSDFGLLPFPKLDENQAEYYNSISPWCTNVIAVPATAQNPERTSIVLEALSAESMVTLTPAYYDITITNKNLRDEESAEMLALILSTRTLDLGFVFNWGGLGMLPSTNYPKADTFISQIEKNIGKAEVAMKKTTDEFKTIKEST